MSTLVRAWCDCGWHGEYDTPARADFATRRHSCSKWRAKRAAARRRSTRDRHVAATRERRDCQHTQARHEHGTHAAYVLDRCRCRPCTDASTAYNIDLKRRNAYGRSNLVDAEPARQHVYALMAAGIGLKTLTTSHGISAGTLTKLVYGLADRPPARRVRRTTADRILAIPLALDAVADGSHVHARPTALRVRALVATGWSVTRIAAAADLDRQALDPLLRPKRRHSRRPWTTSAATARAVADTYERLWNQPPPETTRWERAAAARCRARAAAAGWKPPAGLDDDTLAQLHPITRRTA